jgi:group II intron reverse transcriptase/maturase
LKYRGEESAEAIVPRGGRAEPRERVAPTDLTSGRRQKSPAIGELPANPEGGTRKGCRSVEPQAAELEEATPTKARLMERCVEPGNISLAWKRVKGNGGSAGPDGLTIQETAEYLRRNWVRIKADLLKGGYRPQPVRGVEIPKPGGGMRQLGIPTVVDRLIQQAILQVLQPQWDPTFHPHSFGFRPQKSTQQAVKTAREFASEGKTWVVDVDLEKFFDRVNHDVLMAKVAERVKDDRLLKLIRSYLKAGMMRGGICREREEGTPQGGPLSPLLANLMLDEMDWELAKRGLSFCRYADDCNVYLRSKRGAEGAMKVLEKLTQKLRLKINVQKSAVARVWERKFLGYGLWRAGNGRLKLKVAPQALKKFRDRIRKMTGRSGGKSLQQTVRELGPFLRGWKNYFALSETPSVFKELDGWIRRRLRQMYLKQWKTGRKSFQELVARGLSAQTAGWVAVNRHRYWEMSGNTVMNVAIPTTHFHALGLVRLEV